VATYHSRFVEYLPDGGRRALPVRLPRPDDAIAEISGTTVNAVLPFGRRWLVLAEHTSVVGRGGPVRGFLFDPQRAELEQVAAGTGFAAEPARIGPDRAVWVERRAGSACLSADEIGAYGISVPLLPQRDDERTWAIRRLLAGTAGIDVLARGTDQHSGGCDSDPSYSWLSLRDEGWSKKETGLLDLDLAADGRIARVTGRVCEEGEGCVATGYLSVAVGEADVETPAGATRALPSSTTQVSFSPARSAAVPDHAGDGPALELGMPLESDGFGPLRLGMTATELQAATSTPLTFRLDDAGCGTFEPSDLLSAERLGVEGALREGQLVALRETTLEREPEDEDEDYEPDPLSDLQPDVGSVATRGPRTERGLRAGDPVGMMLELYGPPAARTAPGPTDAVDYTYETDDGTLLLHADGAGVLRRLEFRAGPATPC
jgi:hypothetical protein